ncbi:non-ribosomal peptide synthetase [Paenibacillus glacialis]|uniref:Carrier domain-containing protein n=1 Tax=Paenibacillus glacialis TaxID=494026 RepID=A0A168MJM6_9BACL|nr:non-ribosomal peptide synthetase [Paenibacillus glacialis]OAB44761.1 hypothetical protein PGLA_04930 [Paenibacillus glacialis]
MSGFNLDQPVETFSLSHPQKRIWVVEKIHPGTSLYHLTAVSFKKKTVHFDALEKAILTYIREQDSTRTRFIEHQNEVYQYIRKFEPFSVEMIDFSESAQPQEAFNTWYEQCAQQTFDFENSPLFYFALVKLSINESGYMFKFHHLIADGWSIGSMINSIWDLYAHIIQTKDLPPIKSNSYVDFITSEQKYLESARFLKNKTFWLDKFRTLPENNLEGSSNEIEGKRTTYWLDPALSQTIKTFVGEMGCSLNTFFVSVVVLYLHKVERQKDIVIGTPVLNRSGKKEKEMFGMFTSTMPYRIQIEDQMTIIDLLKYVNEDLSKCYYHQKYPYDLLVRDLEMKKASSQNLFDFCVNYYNTKLVTEIEGDSIETTELYAGSQLYALQMVIKDWAADGSLMINCDYKISAYTNEQIERMFSRLYHVIELIIADPLQKITDISVVSSLEKDRLLNEWNATSANYPTNKLIHQLIEDQVERTPDHIAICFESKQLTYRELNQQSNRLARKLRELGVGRNTIVAMMVSHSPEVIIGILAVLKAGGAYVPVDPDYPMERIQYILEDSGAHLLLTNVSVPEESLFNGKIIDLRDLRLYEGDVTNLQAINATDDLVYLIYTSGSTGKPKGVMIEQQGLVNYIWWARKMYIREQSEAFALYSSLSFDLTVTSVFIPLINGNRINIYASEQSEFVLYRILEENNSHIIKLTPSHLTLLKDLDLKESVVRRFIVGGEDLKASLARSTYNSFGGNIEIYNEYGPTETVVGCMIYRYDTNQDLSGSVPIGKPADNVQLYILDEQLNLLPEGAIGELYISGDGVARGYRNRQDMTQDRFLPNPFVTDTRLYRTGDLVRYNSSGQMDYLGRIDNQVKIRGFRIELGEIESQIIDEMGVYDAVVIDRTQEDGSTYLCAYYIADREISEGELRGSLLSRLPGYMVPTYFVRVDQIPLTPNGKVDRTKLPEVIKKDVLPETADQPINVIEEVLIQTYQTILNVNRIGRRHNFYHMGGDSIKAIQIAAKLNEAGLKVKVKDILALPVLFELAAVLSFHDKSSQMQIQQKPAEGDISALPITSWFFEQAFTKEDHWHQSVLLKLKQPMHLREVKLIVNELIAHHDSLRINYRRESRTLFYNSSHLQALDLVEEIDLTGFTNKQQQEKMIEHGYRIKSQFNIENDPLFRACLFVTDTLGGRTLLLTAHHLVIDAVSWRILLDDFTLLADQFRHTGKLQLPQKTHSYQVWAEFLQAYGKEEGLKELSYWRKVIENGNEFTAMYKDNSISNSLPSQQHMIHAQLEVEETRLLLTEANTAYRTEANDLLVLTLGLAVRNLTQRENIVLELEGHGREELSDDIDLTRTLGWFTSLYPVLLHLTGHDYADLIKSVKEQLRTIPHKGIGYGILRYISQSLPQSQGRSAIRFNYLGQMDNGFDNHLFQLLQDDSGADHAPENRLSCALDIIAAVIDGSLQITVTYDAASHEMNEIERFLTHFTKTLSELIHYCVYDAKKQFTPSDFDTASLLQSEIEMLFE